MAITLPARTVKTNWVTTFADRKDNQGAANAFIAALAGKGITGTLSAAQSDGSYFVTYTTTDPATAIDIASQVDLSHPVATAAAVAQKVGV